MSIYKPFPLLNFQGIHAEKEPWLLPRNAWQTIRNGQVHRGRLFKRDGATFKQQLGIPVTGEACAVAPAQLFNGQLANPTWVLPATDYSVGPPSEYNVKFNGTTASGAFTISVAGVLSRFTNRVNYELIDEATSETRGSIVWGPGFVDHGKWIIVLTEPLTGPCTVDYEYESGEPVMGMPTFIGPDGSEYNLAFDTRRAWLMDDIEERYYEITGGALWTGDETNIFDFGPYDDILVINNGLDPPQKFTASTGLITAMATNYDGVPGNDITAAKMFRDVLGYGVYFATREGGAWYNGRARWTQNGNPEVFSDANDYLDAPSNDVIVTVGDVGSDFLVGFRDSGWWQFQVKSDAFDPFEWLPVPSDKGAVAQNGTVKFSDSLMSRDRYGFSAVNRMGQVDAAPALGEIPIGWNAQTSYMTQSLKYDAGRQVWWTYADAEEDTPQHIAVMQIEADGARHFGTYDLAATALGSYRIAGSPSWDSIEETWDEIQYAWDSAEHRGGFPRILIGTEEGYILEWKGLSSEMLTAWRLKTNVPFCARSIRLNPYPGQRVRLGWLDLILEPSSAGELQVFFYADWESAAYHSETLSFVPGDVPSDKLIRRIKVDHVASFHTIKLREETTNNALYIDYLAPFFKPIGPMRFTP